MKTTRFQTKTAPETSEVQVQRPPKGCRPALRLGGTALTCCRLLHHLWYLLLQNS